MHFRSRDVSLAQQLALGKYTLYGKPSTTCSNLSESEQQA